LCHQTEDPEALIVPCAMVSPFLSFIL
jgi:hypothetical protein